MSVKQKRVHRVKILTPFFKLIQEGKKTFEIRLNDRDYQEGDILHLEEYNPQTNEYTGEFVEVIALYIFDDIKYLQAGYVAIATEIIKRKQVLA